jgi:hypothetical protein
VPTKFIVADATTSSRCSLGDPVSAEVIAKMAYELRIGGRAAARYETSEEAELRARAMMADNADCAVEIFDLSTGQPYAPAASAEDRETLSRKIGF